MTTAAFRARCPHLHRSVVGRVAVPRSGARGECGSDPREARLAAMAPAARGTANDARDVAA